MPVTVFYRREELGLWRLYGFQATFGSGDAMGQAEEPQSWWEILLASEDGKQFTCK